MELFAFDDDYVRRLREGDRWTEEHFRSYFHQLLLIKLRSRLRTVDEIDDCRQEVFLRVFRALKRGDLHDGRKLGAFVNSVCNNLILERSRSARRTEPLEETHEEIAGDEDAEQALVSAETKARVRQILGKLPPRDAAILRAVFLEEKEKEEICEELGVDRAYLRVVLHRAKERFRTEYLGGNVHHLPGSETLSAFLSLPV